MAHLWDVLGTELKSRCLGCTPDLSYDAGSGIYVATERGDEIQAWLDSHPNTVQKFVIVDDDGDMAHLRPFLVKLTNGLD